MYTANAITNYNTINSISNNFSYIKKQLITIKTFVLSQFVIILQIQMAF